MKRNDFYRKNQVAKRGMAWLMILVMTLGLISLGDVTPVKAANVSSGGYTYGVSEETFQDRIDDILTTVCAGTPPAGHQLGFAVDDSLYGEVPGAVIIPEPGHEICLETLRKYLRNRLAHYKVPVYMELRETIPTTANSKPQKFRLRKEFNDKYAK